MTGPCYPNTTGRNKYLFTGPGQSDDIRVRTDPVCRETRGFVNDDNRDIRELDIEATARLILDMFHRIVVHYALWFTEIKHQMGFQKALDTLETVSQKSCWTQINRLSKVLGFPMKGDIPEYLLALPKDNQVKLLERPSK